MSEEIKDLQSTGGSYEAGNSKKKYKGARRNGKPKNVPCDFAKVKDNDVSYYNKYPTDYETAFSYSWFKVMGTDIPYSNLVSSPDLNVTFTDQRIPAVMAINFTPSIGVSNDVNSPVNRCFNMIMADLYAKTSGSNLGFQAADLAMMLTSTASIANLLGVARRALSSTEFWVTKNALYPRALISALGFNYEELIKNKPEFVTRLNSLSHMFNNMQIPAFLDIYKRQFALSHNVFVDEDDEFGQIYVFRPTGYYKYIDTEARAEYTRIGTVNFEQFLDKIEEALGYWVNSSDFYTINGALLRAYKGAETITIPDVDISTAVDLVPPNHILNQLQNTSIVGTVYTNDITQNPIKNQVLCSPTCGSLATNGFLVRLFNDDPNVEEACEATRLIVQTSRVKDAPAVEGLPERYRITSMQTELVESCTIYRVGDDFNTATSVIGLNSNIITGRDGEADLTMLARIYQSFAPFRYVPLVLSAIEAATGITTCGIMGDMYNYTTVTSAQIDNMHKVANLSLWRPVTPSF